MTYSLGSHSKTELQGVHPSLVSIVEQAIIYTSQDFTVHDGLRTLAEQREYVRRGVSRTMRSTHLEQPDGFGHAVDLVPYINGKLRWELDACFDICHAVRKAAEDEGVSITWGGGWCILNDNGRSPEEMVDAYVERKRKQNKRPFIDAPHYQLA